MTVIAPPSPATATTAAFFYYLKALLFLVPVELAFLKNPPLSARAQPHSFSEETDLHFDAFLIFLILVLIFF